MWDSEDKEAHYVNLCHRFGEKTQWFGGDVDEGHYADLRARSEGRLFSPKVLPLYRHLEWNKDKVLRFARVLLGEEFAWNVVWDDPEAFVETLRSKADQALIAAEEGVRAGRKSTDGYAEDWFGGSPSWQAQYAGALRSRRAAERTLEETFSLVEDLDRFLRGFERSTPA